MNNKIFLVCFIMSRAFGLDRIDQILKICVDKVEGDMRPKARDTYKKGHHLYHTRGKWENIYKDLKDYYSTIAQMLRKIRDENKWAVTGRGYTNVMLTYLTRCLCDAATFEQVELACGYKPCEWDIEMLDNELILHVFHNLLENLQQKG